MEGSPWLLGGDFNIFQPVNEKIGGSFRSSRAIMEFNNCIQACGLLDIPLSG